MGFFVYCRRVIEVAFKHSLDWTQWWLFLAILLIGALQAVTNNNEALPSERLMKALVSWQGAAVVFGSIVAMRLILAPYWIWRDDQGKLAAVADSSPRVDVKVVHGPQKSSLYTKTQFWGIRVHNEGIAGTFEGTIRVTGHSSATVQYHPDDVTLAWGDTLDSQKELLNGAYCDLQFCAVERVNPTMPRQNRLWVTGGAGNSHRWIWESQSTVGEDEDLFAIIAVNIYSKPAMIDGPCRLTLRLDRDGLRLSEPSGETLLRKGFSS